MLLDQPDRPRPPNHSNPSARTEAAAAPKLGDNDRPEPPIDESAAADAPAAAETAERPDETSAQSPAGAGTPATVPDASSDAAIGEAAAASAGQGLAALIEMPAQCRLEPSPSLAPDTTVAPALTALPDAAVDLGATANDAGVAAGEVAAEPGAVAGPDAALVAAPAAPVVAPTGATAGAPKDLAADSERPKLPSAARATPQAKPAAGPTMPTAPVESGAPQDGEAELAPELQSATHPATPSAPNRPETREAAERPQFTSLLSDVVQAARPGADVIQLAGLHSGRDFGQTVAAHATATTHGAAGPAANPVALEGLAVEITARAQAGNNRFEIRLDPPELGRIEVRLDIDRSGQVTSRLVVERAETLDVLRRDAHQLERALQDTGLKMSDAGLQFALRDQAFTGRDQAADTGTAFAEPDGPAAESAPLVYGLTLRGNGGIDIRV